MTNDSGDGAARREDRSVGARGCRRHGTLKSTDHTTVVILPTLNARDITVRTHPIVKYGLDNLLERLRIGVHGGHQVGKSCIALQEQRHHDFDLLVGLNLIKPRVNG